MKILLWNVNGIRAAYRQELGQVFNNRLAEIVCIQEVKAWAEQLSIDQLHPMGYQATIVPASKKGYSGVATFVVPEIEHTTLATGFGEERFDQEGRILKSKFADFSLYNIYFPSGSSGELRQAYKYEFLDYVYKYFSALAVDKLARTIVVGDFNICHREIDIHHPKQAERLGLSGFLKPEREWLDKFMALGFIDSFRQIHGDLRDQYTWWSYRAGSRGKNLGWRIDYILLGSALAQSLKNCEILSELKGSDHAAVRIELV